MKTKEDARAWLKEFMARVDSQDNRATAAPVQFLLQVERTIWGQELSNPDVTKWMLSTYDYYNYDSREQLIAALKENGNDDKWIKENEADIASYQGQHFWEAQQAFLTEEGVQRHIALNRHNLGRHRDYVVHSFRNPEIAELYEAIRFLIE